MDASRKGNITPNKVALAYVTNAELIELAKLLNNYGPSLFVLRRAVTTTEEEAILMATISAARKTYSSVCELLHIDDVAYSVELGIKPNSPERLVAEALGLTSEARKASAQS